MTELNIKQTKVSPLVQLKVGEELILEGDSRPEDVSEFYTPIIKWFSTLNDELKNGKITAPIQMVFCLEYLNSSSVIFISKILKNINDIKTQNNIPFNITWKHLEYDEDMIDLGEEFNDIYEALNLNIVAYTK